jgi:hypothetical protein
MNNFKANVVFENEKFLSDFQEWLCNNTELLFAEFEKSGNLITNYMKIEVGND